jgi:hypothetical protein
VNSTDLRYEAALLLACINTTSSPQEKSARIDHLLQKPIEWDYFTRLVMTHGLASTVCAELKSKLGPSGVPLEIFAGLRFWAVSNVKTMDLVVTQLAAVMSRLGAAGICTVTLKGPPLSQLVYGDISVRTSSDLDVLVRPVDVPVAAELLISAGFSSRTYDRKAFTSGFFRNTSDDFTSATAPVAVDLHWRTQERYFPYGPDDDKIWSRSETVFVKGQEVRTLGAGDHLLYLCAHASKHGWPNLASVLDIAALLRARPELDLGALIAEAGRLRFKRMVVLALALAHNLVTAALPNEALRAIRSDPIVSRLTKRISSRLTTQLENPTVISSWVVMASTLELPLDKVRLFLRHVLIPIADDRAKVPLPTSLYPLYYVIRPMRLVGKASMMVAKASIMVAQRRKRILPSRDVSA